MSGRITGPDGKSMAGAYVVLKELSSQGSRSTVTAEDGQFTFDGLPAGLYVLSAAKEGYVSHSFSTDGSSDLAPLRIDMETKLGGLNLRLEKGGVITGRVTLEGGEPVVLARVEAVSLDKLEERRPDLKPFPATTDDRGVYRLFGLPGGRYLVVVHDIEFNGSQRHDLTAYYPGVSSRREALSVEVSSGTEVTNIDFKIDRPDNDRGSISGHITRWDGTPLRDVSVWAYSSENSGMRVTTTPREDGSYELKNVPGGAYTIEVLAKDPTLVERTRRGVFVSQSRPGVVDITVQEGAELSGWFELEDGGRPKYAATLAILVKAEDIHYQNSVRSQADGSFKLMRLPGGSLQLSANTMGSPYYAVRIARGQTELEDGRVSIDPGARVEGIRVILSDGGAVVRGVVQDGGGAAPAAGAWVIVAPADGPRDEFERRARSGRVDQRGQFIIEGIMPGRYFVIATRNPQSLPTDPDILAQWVAQHQSLVPAVDLKPKSEQQLELKLINE